jgi:hypothetical protein
MRANKRRLTVKIRTARFHPAWSIFSSSDESVKRSRAFRDAFVVLDCMIGLFLSLPLATIDQLALRKRIEAIGRHYPPFISRLRRDRRLS